VLAQVRLGKKSNDLKEIFSKSSMTETELQDILVSLLDRVRMCHNEIDSMLSDGNDRKKCEFLSTVWSGDAYGVDFEEGLDELIDEFKTIQAIVKTTKSFVEYVLNDVLNI
jgi:hypothetical protein